MEPLDVLQSSPSIKMVKFIVETMFMTMMQSGNVVFQIACDLIASLLWSLVSYFCDSNYT